MKYKNLTLIILVILCFIPCLIWLLAIGIINDWSVPLLKIEKFHKILIIYPHPDDEVMSTGGLIGLAAGLKKGVTLYFLTKGERGTPDAHLDANLKQTRTEEARMSAKLLHASKLIQDDYGDNELDGKRDILMSRIKEVITQEKPDLIITYDRSGVYGHPDHIIVSEVVTDLVKANFPGTTLWYSSSPSTIKKFADLPEHMAKDPEFKKRISTPSHKVFVGLNVINKVSALYAHKSQYQSFRNAFPFKPVPMGFFVSMFFFEYFYEVPSK